MGIKEFFKSRNFSNFKFKFLLQKITSTTAFYLLRNKKVWYHRDNFPE